MSREAKTNHPDDGGMGGAGASGAGASAPSGVAAAPGARAGAAALQQPPVSKHEKAMAAPSITDDLILAMLPAGDRYSLFRVSKDIYSSVIKRELHRLFPDKVAELEKKHQHEATAEWIPQEITALKKQFIDNTTRQRTAGKIAERTARQQQWLIRQNDYAAFKASVKSLTGLDALFYYGRTSFSLIVRYRKDWMARLYKELVQPNYDRETKSEQSPTHPEIFWAALLNQAADVERLLPAFGDIDADLYCRQTLMQIAVEHGHREIVNLLLEHGANVNGFQTFIPLETAVYKGDIAMVSTLLDAAADVNYRYGFSTSILYTAALRGHTDIVIELLAAGAELEAVDGIDRETALFAAVQADCPSTIQALIDGGANLEARESHGETALVRAIELTKYDVIKTLLAAGAHVDGVKVNITHMVQCFEASGKDMRIYRLRWGEGDSVKVPLRAYVNMMPAEDRSRIEVLLDETEHEKHTAGVAVR